MAILDDPAQQQSLGGKWGNKPYPYQPGGTFLGGDQGGIVGQGGGSLNPSASLFAPAQPIPQEQPRPISPPTGGVPEYSFGQSGDTGPDAGEESKQFASSIGQGVLSASQQAAAMAQAQQRKKQQGGLGGGQMGGGGGGGLGAGFGSGGIMGGEV